MARARIGLLPSTTLGLACAATTWAAVLSWRGFTTSSSFLLPLAAMGLVIALVGGVARWQRLPAIAVMIAQAIVGLVVTNLIVTGTWIPDSALGTEIRASLDAANGYASPVPETSGISVHALILVGGLVAFLLVDAIGATLRRVPAAGLPLLTIYSVPVSLLDGALSWQIFALTALGFLLMLYLQEQLHADRWGRALDGSSDAPAAPTLRASAGRGTAVRISAVAIAISTVAVAVVLPPVLPTLSLKVFDFANGGGGDGDIDINNPMVDLRRDLRRGPNIDLVTITTDGPAPSYLRISVLNRFTDNEWSSGNRNVPSDQVADGSPLPSLQGVEPDLKRTERSYRVEMTDQFSSTWLPTQAPVTSVDADGDWRYDAKTMDFIAGGDNLNTSGQSYSMVGVDLDYNTDDLIASRPVSNDVAPEVLEVPETVPRSVVDLAREVTASEDSPFQKAVALQKWFREDGGFTYSLKRSEEGNSVDELAAFLDKDTGRVGYCEQFSASMAVMARILGIPSRVAVGFLQSTPTGEPDEFVYKSHDLHAWPELYFPGSGWVRFDPTPGARVDSAPSYTDTDVTVGGQDEGPGQQPTSQPTSQPSNNAPTTQPSPAPVEPQPKADEPTTVQSDGFPWFIVLAILLALAVVVALLLAPRTARRRQRGSRHGRGAEAAWEELRATVLDLGHRWPEARSPRETQAALEKLFGKPDDPDPELRPRRGPDQCPAAVHALARIVTDLERGRYARENLDASEELPDDVALVCDALSAGVQPRTRQRAAWWPRSAWRHTRSPGSLGAKDADELEKV